MHRTNHRSAVKSVVAIFCAVCFLTVGLGSVSRAVATDPAAADSWETWPKKKVEPGTGMPPGTEANGAAKAGDAAGKKAATGLSAGTIGWIAVGVAAVIGIGIAAGGGGGGGTTSNH